MTKFIALIASCMLATTVYANDAENTKSTTKDTSKSMFTGKTTETTVEKEKLKDASGSAKAKKTTKVTKDKDGKVIEKKVEMSADGEAK